MTEACPERETYFATLKNAMQKVRRLRSIFRYAGNGTWKSLEDRVREEVTIFLQKMLMPVGRRDRHGRVQCKKRQQKHEKTHLFSDMFTEIELDKDSGQAKERKKHAI